MLAAAAGLILVAAVGIAAIGMIAYVVTARTGGEASADDAAIRQLVEDFAIAVERHDLLELVGLLCAEEAAELTEDDDYDPDQRYAEETVPETVSVETSDIRITGDLASARITRPSQPPATLYFRREAGVWKVCAPAGDELTASPSPSPRQ